MLWWNTFKGKDKEDAWVQAHVSLKVRTNKIQYLCVDASIVGWRWNLLVQIVIEKLENWWISTDINILSEFGLEQLMNTVQQNRRLNAGVELAEIVNEHR